MGWTIKKEDSMNHHNYPVLSLVFGTALLTSPLAWAEGGGQCQRHGGDSHMMSGHGGYEHGGVSAHMLRHLLKNKQDLGLTDEQITKLRTVALNADRARIRAEADVLVSKRELRSLLWDEQAELSAIEAKVKEHEAFEATAHIIGIRAKRELFGILTPEQRAKQKALWEQHRQHDRRHMMRAEAEEGINEANDLNADMDASAVEMSELEDGLSAG
jgi:periplasmic protein CpxP/Spy